MGDRAVAVVKIKASAMKIFSAELEKLISSDFVDKLEVVARYNDLSSSFHKYEEAYETLCVLDQKNANPLEWNEIRSIYYSVASKVAKLKESEASVNETVSSREPLANSTFVEKRRLPRLPDAKVPTFSGNYEEWLSYKNAFLSVVNTQLVDDVVKFIHLRSSLEGEALKKINIYDIRGENYSKAWNTLVDTYERKRILVTKHLNAVLDIAPAQTASSTEVSHLVDEAKQHLNVLEGLGVKVDDAMVICILERALPFKVRQKWEESLELDELPKLEKFYKFVGEAVFRLCTLEANTTRDQGPTATKRAAVTFRETKVRKGNDSALTLVTNATQPCSHCKGPHAIFKCPSFGSLTVQERWDIVRAHKLCVNCLRSHREKCGFGHCKKCDKYHNTLLHDSKPTAPKPVIPNVLGNVPQRDGHQAA